MNKKTIRRKKLLDCLIQEYCQSSTPLASGYICKKYFSDKSPATIRTDLVRLEEKGLIYQPHTSSGRIPTILGYREYLKQNDFSSQMFGNTDHLKTIICDTFRDAS